MRIALGADHAGYDLKWLSTQFAGGRHERRVGKIAEIEKQELQDSASAARNS